MKIKEKNSNKNYLKRKIHEKRFLRGWKISEKTSQFRYVVAAPFTKTTLSVTLLRGKLILTGCLPMPTCLAGWLTELLNDEDNDDDEKRIWKKIRIYSNYVNGKTLYFSQFHIHANRIGEHSPYCISYICTYIIINSVLSSNNKNNNLSKANKKRKTNFHFHRRYIESNGKKLLINIFVSLAWPRNEREGQFIDKDTRPMCW